MHGAVSDGTRKPICRLSMEKPVKHVWATVDNWGNAEIKATVEGQAHNPSKALMQQML